MTNLHTADELTLESLFVDAEALPSPPVAVLEIVRKADDPDVTLEELAALIEFDVALSVQILRISNSSLYSPVNEITSIERALTTLGLRSVRLLALSTSLRMLIPEDADAFDTSEVRRRMVVNGSLARKFAGTLARPQQDEAFLAGMLTGLGPVVLATKAPDVCRELMAETGSWPSAEAERRLMGFTTNDITANLVRNWGLPAGLCDAIEQRAEPAEPDDTALLRCLRLSLLAEKVLCGADPGADLAPLLEAMDDELDMSAEEVHDWLVEAEPMVTEAADLMQFKFPQAQAYGELLVEATLRMQALTMEAHTTIIEGSRQLEALSQRNLELQQEAHTDALTQLPNRGVFDETLATRLEESRRQPASERSLGMLMLDLDHFKSVNDTHGHAIGDEVLRLVGNVLQQGTRGDDLPARYGGEEFVVLAPNATLSELAVVAERLRERIGELVIPLPDGGSISVTVSIGGSLLGEIKADSGQTFVERADKRLYEAKHRGRNRVILV